MGGFFEALIRALLYLCALALCYFLVIWVLGEIGIILPIMVTKIVMVMFALIAILILFRLFSPWATGFDWWGRGRGP